MYVSEVMHRSFRFALDFNLLVFGLAGKIHMNAVYQVVIHNTYLSDFGTTMPFRGASD